MSLQQKILVLAQRGIRSLKWGVAALLFVFCCFWRALHSQQEWQCWSGAHRREASLKLPCAVFEKRISEHTWTVMSSSVLLPSYLESWVRDDHLFLADFVDNTCWNCKSILEQWCQSLDIQRGVYNNFSQDQNEHIERWKRSVAVGS